MVYANEVTYRHQESLCYEKDSGRTLSIPESRAMWLEGWVFEPHDKEVIIKKWVSINQQESFQLNLINVHIILCHSPFPVPECVLISCVWDLLHLYSVSGVLQVENIRFSLTPMHTFTHSLQDALMFTEASHSDCHNYLGSGFVRSNSNTSLSELVISKLILEI